MLLGKKVAIVTGAAQGIGKAIALALGREGADVVVADLQLGKVKEVAQEIERMGKRSLAIQSDVTIYKQVEEMVEKTIDQFGKVEILVNNAGINRLAKVVDMTEKDWDDILAVNTKGVFLCSQTAARKMIERGSGCIINMASNCGGVARVDLGAYCASKAATIHLTRVMALELAKYGIRVNAVCPGSTESEMQRDMQQRLGLQGKIVQGDLKIFRTGIPLGKMAAPEDQAAMVVYLASEAAKHITGQAYYVDGGQTML